MIKNLEICPEDELHILLEAQKIPHEAVITKRTGEKRYTLRHNLVVYRAPSDPNKEPLTIYGVFIISDTGSINQIEPTTELLWHVPADQFIDAINASWDQEDDK